MHGAGAALAYALFGEHPAARLSSLATFATAS